MIMQQTQCLIDSCEARRAECVDEELYVLLVLVIEGLKSIHKIASARQLTGHEFLQYRDVLIDARRLIQVIDEERHVFIEEAECLQCLC